MTTIATPRQDSRTPVASVPPGVLHSFVGDPQFGTLPALLLGMTVVTGLVDAVSILRLGRVFVANMTGNVVFLGFAAARAPGFSLVASLVALAGFMVGAAVGGRLARRGGAATHLLATASFVETILVAAALAVVVAAGLPAPLATTSAVAGLLALAMAMAMGIQNAVARHLAVPDLTTTALTMALTGFAADPRSHPRGRRAASVIAMFGGAVLGAALVMHGQAWAALGVATGLLLAVAALAVSTSHTHPQVS
jgi:uncharacterized membrane protein YoaK (UPF0700 family)